MKSRILGTDGQPIELAKLTEEVAIGGATSIRQVWTASVARGLTPAALAALLDRAAQGDASDLLTLAEEVEERDPHYAAVLGVRKRAAAGQPIVVEAPTEEAKDVEIADAVRELTRLPEFGDLIGDLLDAIGKPYSVCEIIWDRGRMWTPREYPHRDPRWFRFDQDTGRELRLIDEADTFNGVALPPYKFLVHRPRMKSGLQIRSGTARIVALYLLAKMYGKKDWLAFAEVAGLPLRVGRYGPNASPEDKRILRQAVASIGSDAAAVLPESMKIEFVDTKGGSNGHQLYERLCDWIDRQVSKAVLGQTMTTDAQSAGMGSNQATVHNDVRDDILKADVRDLAVTINRDLVRPFVDLNFGPQKAYPRLSFHIAEPEDLKLLSESLVKLVPLGLEVEQSVIRDKFGLPEPATGAKLLGAPKSEPETAAPKPGKVALNREEAPRSRDRVDQLAEMLAPQADSVVAGWISTIRTFAEGANSLQELRDGLTSLLPQLDDRQFAAAMGFAMSVAGVGGMADADEDSDA